MSVEKVEPQYISGFCHTQTHDKCRHTINWYDKSWTCTCACHKNNNFEKEKMTNWVHTEEKDVSFEHCGIPAYWQDDEVYCSKCQEKLEEYDGRTA